MVRNTGLLPLTFFGVATTMSGGNYHIPVMAEAVVSFLADAPTGVLVDGTLGGGGHLMALAEATPADRQLIGVDQDPDALAAAGARFASRPELAARVRLLHGNFGDLPELLKSAGVVPATPVAGVLLDLGVSSHQLDEAARGFGFKHADAPLDMRMDPSDETRPTALDLVAQLDVDDLTRIIRDHGEIKHGQARRIARSMREALEEGRLETTRDLADVVEAVTGPRRGKGTHPATTVFQALRIAVNGELDALDQALADAPELLTDGGRFAVMSYHSLEDRRVKQAFRLGEQGPPRPGHLPPPSGWHQTWRSLTRKPVRASDEEIAANPRARSAMFRVAERWPREVAR